MRGQKEQLLGNSEYLPRMANCKSAHWRALKGQLFGMFEEFK
jgi:hypothetical protein